MQRIFFALPSIAIFVAVGCSQPNQYKAPPPPSVTVARPLVSRVTNYLDETGTTEAVERVEIRARVRGYLQEVRFEDGDDVHEGDELYLIQPREFEAKAAAAKANVAAMNVALIRAGIELDRQNNLIADNATAQASVDTAVALKDGAKAAVDAAQAELDQAELDLEYTAINAPIKGRVERTLVKQGNLVGDGEATHLTTMISYDQIYVYFNISERSLLRVRSNRDTESQEEPDITRFKAYLRRAVDKGFPYEGNLDYADLGVDQSTGTFTVRAVFSNETRDIMPGLFVRIRVPLGEPENAVLLPERCVAVDQAGRFVIILDEKNVVERRNVKLGEKHGEFVVITDGLDGTETVVIDGIQKARPGATVTPKEITLDASSIEEDRSRAAAEIVPDEVEADTPDADPAETGDQSDGESVSAKAASDEVKAANPGVVPSAAEPSPENGDDANTSTPSDASDK